LLLNSHAPISGLISLYAVSARETDRGYSGREDLWFIVAIRSEDEAEIRAGETAGAHPVLVCRQHPAPVGSFRVNSGPFTMPLWRMGGPSGCPVATVLVR